MFIAPTLSHIFDVHSYGNMWNDNMRGRFTRAVHSIDVNYVTKEICLEIANLQDLTIQECIDDIIQSGIRTLSLNTKQSDRRPEQIILFRNCEAIHHSLKFCYDDAGVSYHFLVLKYKGKEYYGER